MTDELNNFQYECVMEGGLGGEYKAKFTYLTKNYEVNFFAAANEMEDTPAFEQIIRGRCLVLAKDMMRRKQEMLHDPSTSPK